MGERTYSLATEHEKTASIRTNTCIGTSIRVRKKKKKKKAAKNSIASIREKYEYKDFRKGRVNASSTLSRHSHTLL